MLEKVVQDIIKGIEINTVRAYAKKVTAGRFKEEVNLSIFLKENNEEEYLFSAKVYYGNEPFYLPWVEIFSIRNHVPLKTPVEYFDSVIEEILLKVFSKPLGPGGKIYVEYHTDRETSYGLMHGFPPPATRLGYKLFTLGFTWFKDWYFPEGGSEGGQKLQGEKPIDKIARKRHLKDISNEVSSFIREIKGAEILDDSGRYLLRAKERAESVLRQIERMN